MLGNRGSDAWEAIKWIPRFILIALCLVLIVYIFSVFINVDYDAQAVRADHAVATILFSDAFSHSEDPDAIDLSQFTGEAIAEIYPLIEREEQEDVLVEVLEFAPISARLTLSSLGEPFETTVVYYEQDTYETLEEFYLEGARSSIRYARSENLVRVYPEPDSAEPTLARLTIEVLI